MANDTTKISRNFKIFSLIGLATVSVTILSGCSSIKRTLGFEKAPPDEFSVVKKAPLTIPPDFNLRPPVEKDPKQESLQARDAAEATMTGKVFEEDRVKKSGIDQKDKAVSDILAKARAQSVTTQDTKVIRKQVNEEAGVYTDPEDSTFVERVLFWQKKDKPASKVIDPVEEQKALLKKTKEEKE